MVPDSFSVKSNFKTSWKLLNCLTKADWSAGANRRVELSPLFSESPWCPVRPKFEALSPRPSFQGATRGFKLEQSYAVSPYMQHLLRYCLDRSASGRFLGDRMDARTPSRDTNGKALG
jgi:hypothetical protein